MKRRMVVLLALAIVAALAFASTASAIPWTEIGDAGNLPATAQVTAGSGPLTSISGVIGPLSFTDADLYRIHIPVSGAFSATTVGTGGTLIDTQLFLFDLAGLGIYGRDDNPGTARTTLPAGSPLGPQLAGDFFLAITGFNLDPVNAGGRIFPDTPRATLHGPTGPGGGSRRSRNWPAPSTRQCLFPARPFPLAILFPMCSCSSTGRLLATPSR